MNLMLIEDHATDMKLLTTVLDTAGYRVIQHGSAEQALPEIRATPPDVILLDLKLPGMDGLALVRLLKADPKTRHIPVVAVTAATPTFSSEQAFAAGCSAYIVKPVDTRELGNQVAAASSGGAGAPGRGAP